MYHSIKSVALALVVLLPSMAAWAGENSLVGTWAMKSFVFEPIGSGERYYPLGEHAKGYVSYSSDGRMYLIQTTADRVKPQGSVPTDDERIKLHASMTAYTGTYSTDNGKVTHHVDMSWNEAWTGSDQVRFYTVEGNTLTWKTGPIKNPLDGRDVIAVLVWEKVKSITQ
jgi:hypothetical protein